MCRNPQYASGMVKKTIWHHPFFRIVLIPLIIELFVFNYPFFESLGYQEQRAAIEAGSGFTVDANGTYSVIDEDDAYIDITGLHDKTRNLYFAFENTSPTGPLSAGDTYTLTISTIDESGNVTFTCSPVTVSTNIEATKYVNIDTAGNSFRISISDAQQFRLDDIGINVHRPIFFSWLRVTVMVILALAVTLFRGKSKVYTEDVNLGIRHQRIAVIAFLSIGICAIVVSALLTNQARLFRQGEYWDDSLAHVKDENQYDHLANSLIEGHLYLDLPVSPVLAEMDNPYDVGTRTALNRQAHDPIYWDYAYYQGHYYCYFGVLPALLLYVPFKLFTGADLQTHYAVMALGISMMLGLFFLVFQLRKRYFEHVSFGAFLLGAIASIAICCLFEQTMLPRIYEVPMLMSLTLTSFGLGCWISVSESPLRTRRDHFTLMLGSLLLALNLASRPIFFVSVLLAFPIFHTAIFRQRLFFSRQGIKNTLCVVMPCVLVSSAVMWYNFARFSSPLDFGATYNLTGGDMTSRGVSLHRVATGLFEYLFQPVNLHPVFPFVTTVNSYIMTEGYQGPISSEPFYGGMFALMPVAFFAFLAISRKSKKQYRELWRVCLTSFILALLILLVDAQVSGITMRYFSDFGLFITLTTVPGVWQFLDSSDVIPRVEYRNSFVFVLTLISLLLYGWTFLGVERFDALVYTRPYIFYGLKSWFIPFT